MTNKYNVTITWLDLTSTTFNNVWAEDRIQSIWGWYQNGDLAFCVPYREIKRIIKAA